VDILMETSIPSVFFGPNLTLSNDDYAGRQFLYPIPEPASLTLLLTGVLVCLRRREWGAEHAATTPENLR
jgi:hypothetical protein